VPHRLLRWLNRRRAGPPWGSKLTARQSHLHGDGLGNWAKALIHSLDGQTLGNSGCVLEQLELSSRGYASSRTSWVASLSLHMTLPAVPRAMGQEAEWLVRADSVSSTPRSRPLFRVAWNSPFVPI
jgi:hypothetical protein